MVTSRYGMDFNGNYSALDIELYCIRQGGRWTKNGQTFGLGLFEHHRNAQKLLWSEDDEHRWSSLLLRSFTHNDVTVVMGASDSGKTYCASKFILTDWWAFPKRTLWMVSSTELRGAELRIWGVLKQLFNRARERFPDLAGTVLESAHAITSDQISETGATARLLTRGIIVIPCKRGGTFVGLGAYQGIKGAGFASQGGRLGHCGDEVSAMEPVFLDAYSNWYGKESFRGILLGNPGDLDDPLSIAGEPLEGWENWHDTGKTQEWEGKFYKAHVIALDGRDTPNNDFSGPFTKYPYLVGKKKLEAVAQTHGADSWQWFNQCVGKPRPHAQSKRVISRELCERHRAFDKVIWSSSSLTRIAGCDAAYGGVGGDRCVGGHIDFGKDVEGHSVICVHPPVIVPVSVKNTEEPEVQIAKFMKSYCEGFSIPPQNFFFDARATLAVRLTQVWSPQVNALEFGGKPSQRPVSLDEFVWDGNEKTRRLKLCSEHYDRFVTELWYSSYYIIVSDQMRELPKDVALEGCKRSWEITANNRVSVETKDDMKARTGRSPDLFDWLVICLEGARRLGFQISKLGNDELEPNNNEWLSKLQKRQELLTQRLSLSYSR